MPVLIERKKERFATKQPNPVAVMFSEEFIRGDIAVGEFACRDDSRKSCILNGDRLSCPARNVDLLMTSDVNKGRDVTQKLRHSSD